MPRFLTASHAVNSQWQMGVVSSIWLEVQVSVYVFLQMTPLYLCIKTGKNSKLSCTFGELQLGLSKSSYFEAIDKGLEKHSGALSNTLTLPPSGSDLENGFFRTDPSLECFLNCGMGKLD